MSYTFIADIAKAFSVPEQGIMSRILHKDTHANVTAFSFSTGQELSKHSAPTPAILYVLEGEAEVLLGEDTVQAHSGSFVYMPPMLPHGIRATSAVKMLLIQMKESAV